MHSIDYLMPWSMLSFLFTGLWSVVSILVYLFVAFCLYTIAKKTNTQYPWLAFIPFANIVLACQIAGKPWWWVFLFLIPIVNIVLGIIVMWKICERRNKPGWLGILIIVPVVNIIVLAIVAFVD
jgi:uncharacterized membrane protein YoaK (UPF0700 family)